MLVTEVTKADFAKAHGNNRAWTSVLIKRGHLSGAAVTADGKINVEEAERQLARRSSSQATRAAASATKAAPVATTPSAPTQGDLLLEARTMMARTQAERARRELEAERGRYMLADRAAAAWSREFGNFVLGIEQAFPDLMLRLNLGREQGIELRRWWREHRMATAAGLSAQIDAGERYRVDQAA